MAELSERMRALVQPHLAAIEPYDPNFTPTEVNLSANENTYDLPAGVRAAIDAALAATPLNRYPDPMSNELRDELAAWRGVPRDMVCVGNGGDELLFNFLLAFGGQGRTLLTCPPDFGEHAVFASLAARAGARLPHLPRAPSMPSFSVRAAFGASCALRAKTMESTHSPSRFATISTLWLERRKRCSSATLKNSIPPPRRW